MDDKTGGSRIGTRVRFLRKDGDSSMSNGVVLARAQDGEFLVHWDRVYSPVGLRLEHEANTKWYKAAKLIPVKVGEAI